MMFKRILSSMILASAVTVFSVSANAQSTDGATQVVAALPASQALPKSTLDAIKLAPEAVLSAFPEGGPALAAYIARIVGSDIAMLPVVMGLVGKANAAQTSALGRGLSLAGKAYGGVGNDAATAAAQRIGRSVASTGNARLTASYQAGQQGQATAAIVAPAPSTINVPGTQTGGGAVGTGGSTGGTTTGSTTASGSTTVGNSGGGLSSFASGGTGSSGGTTTTTSVSPSS